MCVRKRGRALGFWRTNLIQGGWEGKEKRRRKEEVKIEKAVQAYVRLRAGGSREGERKWAEGQEIKEERIGIGRYQRGPSGILTPFLRSNFLPFLFLREQRSVADQEGRIFKERKKGREKPLLAKPPPSSSSPSFRRKMNEHDADNAAAPFVPFPFSFPFCRDGPRTSREESGFQIIKNGQTSKKR